MTEHHPEAVPLHTAPIWFLPLEDQDTTVASITSTSPRVPPGRAMTAGSGA